MNHSKPPINIYNEARTSFQTLSNFNPEAFQGFTQYIHAVENDGVLPKKIKEIILVALALSKQCEWCIVYHTRKALESGASREELMEASLVASFMGGGPVMMYSQLMVATIDEYQAEID